MYPKRENFLNNQKTYWLVDPLDGTKDFLALNGEFTVNIALISDCKPVLGVVYAPSLKELYVGTIGRGAWLLKNGAKIILRKKRKRENIRMAVSRFHNLSETNDFSEINKINNVITMGSALKYVRIACGEIDVYPRLVGSSEWDTAAGQAILEAVGGSILDWHTGRPLKYGKKIDATGVCFVLELHIQLMILSYKISHPDYYESYNFGSR